MLRHAGETEGEMEGIKGQRAGERQTGGVLHHYEKPGLPENLKTFIPEDECTPMFTAALFTVAKTWRPPKCPLTEDWIRKLRHMYTVEYYLAIRKDEMPPSVTTWMGLKNIMLSKIRQKKSRTM